MTIDHILVVLTIILGLLTLVLSVLGGYVGFLSHTLQKRVQTEVLAKIEKRLESVDTSISSRLQLLENVLEILGSAVAELDARGHLKTELYAVSHILRLLSVREVEVKNAILALEGLAPEIPHLLPVIERIRASNRWSKENQERYTELLWSLKARTGKRREA